jgi:hypothetical protein
MPSVRRLTAILAADVAGYSRLMGADEEGVTLFVAVHTNAPVALSRGICMRRPPRRGVFLLHKKGVATAKFSTLLKF